MASFPNYTYSNIDYIVNYFATSKRVWVNYLCNILGRFFLENQAFPNKLVHNKMTQSLLRLYANRCPLTKLIVSRYIARARRNVGQSNQ